ncbi:MAG: nucleotidyltransferase family protein [Armatimonadetes bacterium]|nr:nucleotidyltransferase family protein [Armatimonadota bacterium]
MKAILLAAGLGTRLSPITNKIPKCLVPINNKPLLQYWIDLFEFHGIYNVLINLHHFPGKVKEYISGYKGNIEIKHVFEKELSGSLGIVLQNQWFYENESCFLVCYADNLTNIDLSEIIKYHSSHDQPITMGLFHTNKPEQCGIAVVNKEMLITDFIEKPKEPTSNLASAGIFVIEPQLLHSFSFKDENSILDFGFDLLPQLVYQMKGFVINDYILDIGTLDNLNEANSFVREHTSLFEYPT